MKISLISFYFFLSLLLTCRIGFPQQASEYQIKATYLFNFAKFTHWPAPKNSSDQPIEICLLKQDPFDGTLDELVRGKLVKNRPIYVRTVQSSGSVSSCYILFISNRSGDDLPSLLSKLKENSVLSVGESADFLNQGGQINFFLKEMTVKFEVNLPAVEQAGIQIDARVLNIAKIRR